MVEYTNNFFCEDISSENDNEETTEEIDDNSEDSYSVLSISSEAENEEDLLENTIIDNNFSSFQEKQIVNLPSLNRMSTYEITYVLQVRSNIQENLKYNKIIDTVLPYFDNDIEYNVARIELYLGLLPLKIVRHMYSKYFVICNIEDLEIDHEFYLNENELNYLKIYKLYKLYKNG